MSNGPREATETTKYQIDRARRIAIAAKLRGDSAALAIAQEAAAESLITTVQNVLAEAGIDATPTGRAILVWNGRGRFVQLYFEDEVFTLVHRYHSGNSGALPPDKRFSQLDYDPVDNRFVVADASQEDDDDALVVLIDGFCEAYVQAST